MNKLLILGGITHMLDVVYTAKNMGVFTIVCDYASDSPAKKIADKSYDVSTTDIDALESIARENDVNAVFAGFEDLNTWNALELCQRLNLPFYASKEQLSITSNKLKFKEFCRKAGIPVVPEYKLTCSDDILSIPKSAYPVIIKPADSYASRGITVCHNAEDLSSAFSKAIAYSKSQNVIVEHFVRGYGVEMYYTVIDGNIYLSAMTDRYVVEQEGGVPPLPTATVFPSKHLKWYCGHLDNKFQELIHLMNIRNGLILFQAVLENDNLYVYEMAYRLTGEQHYQIIRKETGVDLMRFMIDLSLSRDVSQYEISNYGVNCLPCPACNYAVLLKKGKIKRIEGLDLILSQPEIISHVQTLFVGDEIETIGNYGQIVVRFNIVADTNSDLIRILDFINNNLKVISENEEDMVLHRFANTDIFSYDN